MKGLLIKDWQLLKNQKSFFVIIAVMVAVYAAMGNVEFVVSYTPMMCVFVAMSTITYDTFDNGSAFLFTMPFSRKDYVREKYIFSGLIEIAAQIVSIGVALVLTISHGEDCKEMLVTYIILCAMGFLLMGFSIPIQLKFGAEKSRVASILVIALVFGMLIAFFKVMEKLEMKPDQVFAAFCNMSTMTLVLPAIIAFVALMGISYVISIKIMMNKEM